MAEWNRLRVMSFNIHAGIGCDDVLNLERIARVIAEQQMDVVGLQEVDRRWRARTEFVDQAEWFAQRLQMHVAFGANKSCPPQAPDLPPGGYGLATLSRTPIVNSQHQRLPTVPGNETRGVLGVRITLGETPVYVFNTHLQHNSSVDRVRQAREVRTIAHHPERRTIVLGDFNAAAGTSEITELATHFTDTWLAAGVGPGYTFSATNLCKRIDYIFTSELITPESAYVVPTDASDHLPLVVDLCIQ